MFMFFRCIERSCIYDRFKPEYEYYPCRIRIRGISKQMSWISIIFLIRHKISWSLIIIRYRGSTTAHISRRLFSYFTSRYLHYVVDNRRFIDASNFAYGHLNLFDF